MLLRLQLKLSLHISHFMVDALEHFVSNLLSIVDAPDVNEVSYTFLALLDLVEDLLKVIIQQVKVGICACFCFLL